MVCTQFTTSAKFIVPHKTAFVWMTQTQGHNPFELDYMLGLADAIYRKYTDDTVAVYLKEAFYVLNSGNIIEYCIPELEIMRQRRELLAKEYVMKAMEDRMTAFDHKFVELLSVEKYKEKFGGYYALINAIGTIATFPKIYDQTVERIYFNDILDKIRASSGYIDAPKSRVNLKLKLISRRWSRDNGTWIVNALHDDTNLVTYFDSKSDISKIQIGNDFKIRATVVKHTFSDFTRCKETRVSRVVYS